MFAVVHTHNNKVWYTFRECHYDVTLGDVLRHNDYFGEERVIIRWLD